MPPPNPQLLDEATQNLLHTHVLPTRTIGATLALGRSMDRNLLDQAEQVQRHDVALEHSQDELAALLAHHLSRLSAATAELDGLEHIVATVEQQLAAIQRQLVTAEQQILGKNPYALAQEWTSKIISNLL
ncbi:hypothetical protein H4R33_006921 [Dimargaris cristalligena]|nr:hypothetical protein H4R33_006921 [Dimargaris cristalligena]